MCPPDVEARPEAVPQLEMSGEEVRVEVGEEDMLDAHPPLLRHRDILVDVPLGVDDHGGPASLVAEEVGRMGEAAQVELMEEHRNSSVVSGPA
jgi:hypothetical protein